MHDEELLAPISVLYVPTRQGLHVPESDAPLASLHEPAAHDLQPDDPGLKSYHPVGQS